MILKTKSGNTVHPIGIGTWGIGGTWETKHGNEAESIKAIHYSISKGQNHIDSGQIYGAGYTDEIIGQAIDGQNREDLYIGDKIWETSVGKSLVRPAVKTILKKLKTSYIDLLYIHKPWNDWPWREAIPQINSLIDEGLVRQFGVSNFNIDQLQETMKQSRHPVVVNQLHHNVLYRQDVNPEMSKFCLANNIQLIAYRPLEQGKVLENEVIKAIAKTNNATPVQVALAWLLAQGMLPIPMATELKFIDENLGALKLKLSLEDIKKLDALIPAS